MFCKLMYCHFSKHNKKDAVYNMQLKILSHTKTTILHLKFDLENSYTPEN